MNAAIITPSNLKKIGFKEIIRGEDVYYERAGYRIDFGTINGVDCIHASVQIPMTRLLNEIEEKIAFRLF